MVKRYWIKGLWIGIIVGILYFLLELILSIGANVISELSSLAIFFGITNIFDIWINFVFPTQIVGRFIGGLLSTIFGFGLSGLLVGGLFKK